MDGMHIADISFPDLYVGVFPSRQEAEDFYSEIQDLPPQKNAAKLVFHQAARMIWLADRIDDVAHGRPAFQVLFYLIAAELAAKITFGFKGVGQSRKYVHRFFSEICGNQTRGRLAKSFWRMTEKAVALEEAVDLLYDIRCDVVHEGMYFGFHLQDDGDRAVPQAVHVGERVLQTDLTVLELRKMVLTGAVEAARRLLGTSTSALATSSGSQRRRRGRT